MNNNRKFPRKIDPEGYSKSASTIILTPSTAGAADRDPVMYRETLSGSINAASSGRVVGGTTGWVITSFGLWSTEMLRLRGKVCRLYPLNAPEVYYITPDSSIRYTSKDRDL